MKQLIDHSNYEAWLLDRLEGNLSAEQEAELKAFLLLHPHLDPGSEELPAINEAAAKLGTQDKEALKRHLPPVAKVDAGNIEDHLIARLENDLTREQLEALRLFLEHHPEHQHAERLYALTKLVPKAMVFAAKSDVHRALPPQGMPTRLTLDDFLVARFEGDLRASQEKALDRFIAEDPSAQRAWSLMQATRVRASHILFADKATLKQGGRVIAISRTSWTVRLAAAASVLLILGMAWWWWQSPDRGAQVAEEERRSMPVQQEPQAQHGVEQYSDASPNEQQESSTEEPSSSESGSDPQPQRNEKPANAPVMVPQNEEPLAPIAAQAPDSQQEREQQPQAPTIQQAPIPEEQPALASAGNMNADETQAPPTAGQALAATLRERVLDAPGDAARPLDENDAVAAVDRGLKALGGQRTGFDVRRDDAGRNRGFNLRLGRNLAISASR